MRGLLSEEILFEIDKRLASLDDNWLKICSPDLFVLLTDSHKKTEFHIALVCLEDACHRFNAARKSIFEALACFKFYENKSITAIHSSKFYIDYAALLFYTISEDIAEFILKFENIENEYTKFWTNYDNKENVCSKAGKLGVFIFKNKTSNFLFKELCNNIKDLYRKIKPIIDYRNNWVHHKPPIIDGLGIEYNRKSKIIDSGSFVIGGISRPDYKIEKLHELFIKGLKALSDFLNKVIDRVYEKQKEWHSK